MPSTSLRSFARLAIKVVTNIVTVLSGCPLLLDVVRSMRGQLGQIRNSQLPIGKVNLLISAMLNALTTSDCTQADVASAFRPAGFEAA